MKFDFQRNEELFIILLTLSGNDEIRIAEYVNQLHDRKL